MQYRIKRCLVASPDLGDWRESEPMKRRADIKWDGPDANRCGFGWDYLHPLPGSGTQHDGKTIPKYNVIFNSCSFSELMLLALLPSGKH